MPPVFDLSSGRPLHTTSDYFLHIRIAQCLSIVAEGVMDDSARAIALCEDERLGLFAPVGVCLHEDIDFFGALELCVQLVVGLEIAYALGDWMFVVYDLCLDDASWAVT